jgi:glycosidase
MQKIYEINTRPWFLELQSKIPNLTLSTIPISKWLEIKNLGFDAVWLLGVWDNQPKSLEGKSLALPYINEYKKSLPDITSKDILDSCFAINDYNLNPILGVEEDLLILKKQLEDLGLLLILDFVPNHFNAYSDLVYTNPEIFVTGSVKDLERSDLFYKLPNSEIVIAHGRDRYAGSWIDTAQINWANQSARNIMQDKLSKISHFCHGVRCDMAMLNLNKIFDETWGQYATPTNFEVEWWQSTISKVKKINPDFVFIAESYWGTDTYLLDIGFDYVYNKHFYDSLKNSNLKEIKALFFNCSFLPSSVFFLENHDEDRLINFVEYETLKTAVILLLTIPGLKLFYDGQLAGRKIKLPMQLGRWPEESFNQDLFDFYKKILNMTNSKAFDKGSFEVISIQNISETSTTGDNILAFTRKYKSQEYLILVNFSSYQAEGFVPLFYEFEDSQQSKVFEDLLTDKMYEYSQKFLNTHNLYIKLNPWQAHIFRVT